jgi:prevent-host-death family protein
MPLDFQLISMTDLRSRPGEVLDRVADNGEGFIIERNGRRSACLVPLSLFFPDISPERIANEIAELSTHDEKARMTITKDRELEFRFPHKLADGTLELNIILPHGYPNNCPRVYVSSLKTKTPHRWSDGSLCLFGVMSAWNPGKHTVFSTLTLARSWLSHYDTWRNTGSWPKPEVAPRE